MALLGEPSRPMKSFINNGHHKQHHNQNLNADIISNISNIIPKPKAEQNITPIRGNSPADNEDNDEGIDDSIDLSSVNMQSMQLRQRPKPTNYS